MVKMRLPVVSNELIRGGETVIDGTRIPLVTIMEIYSQGANIREILETYPTLTKEIVNRIVEHVEEIEYQENDCMKYSYDRKGYIEGYIEENGF